MIIISGRSDELQSANDIGRLDDDRWIYCHALAGSLGYVERAISNSTIRPFK